MNIGAYTARLRAAAAVARRRRVWRAPRVLLLGARRVARGARGAGLARCVAIVLSVGILANPSLVEEQRKPLRDVAVIVVDDSPSQQIGDRTQITEAALATLTDRLDREPDLDVRVIRAGKAEPGAGDDGTRLFTAAQPRARRRAAAAPRRRGHDHRRRGPRRAGRIAQAWPASARRCTCC